MNLSKIDEQTMNLNKKKYSFSNTQCIWLQVMENEKKMKEHLNFNQHLQNELYKKLHVWYGYY